MKDYKLKEDEVILYKGNVSFENKKGNTELILTNLNLIFITKYKKLFCKEETTVDTYSVNDIKIYKEIPQIKTDGCDVEIFLLTTEIEFSFFSKADLRKFITESTKLLTGKTTVERSAEKVKKTIELFDDTLGIDTVNIAGKVVKNGIISTTTGAIGKGVKIIGNFFKKKK